MEALSRRNNIYGDTNVTGQATAVLGDVHGDINIRNATLLLSPRLVDQNGALHPRIERYNRVLPNRTIETVITYNEDITAQDAGVSSKIELDWERREDLGSGVFGVVHREECSYGSEVKSRAVKVLRMRQLKDMKINYKKEIGALLRLSDVTLPWPLHIGLLMIYSQNTYIDSLNSIHGTPPKTTSA